MLEKYPVYTLEIKKSETTFTTVEEIIVYIDSLIEAHPIAKFIANFDQYAHTSSIGGEINDEIKDAKSILFCFGKAIPNTKILAARPRSFAICELENSFFIEFLEAPMEQLNNVMEDWARSVANK